MPDLRFPIAVFLSLFTGLFCAASEKGWIDLLGDDASLSGWVRAPFPGKTLGDRNPWSLDPATGILRCEAAGIHENFLHRVVRGDGVFHVEWRYPEPGEKLNSGAYVRTAADGTAWLQAQLAPEGLGLLFGSPPGEPARRLRAGEASPGLHRPAGEWNTLEIVARGDTIRLRVNGAETATLSGFPARTGLVGLEAEFNLIEFRNVRFKPDVTGAK